MDQKPKQLTLSFPIKSATEVEAEYRQWAKSLPPGVTGFSPLGSLMRVPVREEPPVQEEPREIEDPPNHDTGTLHLDRPRPVQDEDPEARLMKWLESKPPSDIRDAALEVLRDEVPSGAQTAAGVEGNYREPAAVGATRCRCVDGAPHEAPRAAITPVFSERAQGPGHAAAFIPLSAERATYRAEHGPSDQEFKDWLESLPPGGTFRLVRRKPKPE